MTGTRERTTHEGLIPFLLCGRGTRRHYGMFLALHGAPLAHVTAARIVQVLMCSVFCSRCCRRGAASAPQNVYESIPAARQRRRQKSGIYKIRRPGSFLAVRQLQGHAAALRNFFSAPWSGRNNSATASPGAFAFLSVPLLPAPLPLQHRNGYASTHTACRDSYPGRLRFHTYRLYGLLPWPATLPHTPPAWTHTLAV